MILEHEVSVCSFAPLRFVVRLCLAFTPRAVFVVLLKLLAVLLLFLLLPASTCDSQDLLVDVLDRGWVDEMGRLQEGRMESEGRTN